MRIDILTLFPEYFDGPLSVSMMKRAVEKGLAEYHLHQIRDHGKGKRRQVDDAPYGGGAGLVMMAEILMNAYESVPKEKRCRSFLLSPRGRRFDQRLARELATHEQLILIAGHYEGIDQRFIDLTGIEELSLGDFVLTGGEPAAAVVADAVVRLIPGVLGNEESTERESFSLPLLEHDHYTMPREFRGLKVPKVLFSGDHAKIEAWRKKSALMRTLRNRPELLALLPENFFDDDK